MGDRLAYEIGRLRRIGSAGLSEDIPQDGRVSGHQHTGNARQLLALQWVHVAGSVVRGAQHRGQPVVVRRPKTVGVGPERSRRRRLTLAAVSCCSSGVGQRRPHTLGLLRLELLPQLGHVEQTLHLELFGDLHDPGYLGLGHVHLPGVHVLEQGSHLELLHAWKQDAAVVHGHVHQDRLEVGRVSCQDYAVRFELHVLVDDYGAVDVVLHLYEDVQDLDEVRLVVVPSQAIRLTFAAAHFEF